MTRSSFGIIRASARLVRTGQAFAFFSVLAASGIANPASAQTSGALARADGASVPVLIYAPGNGAVCAPTMVLSHGFGGDERALSGLAKAVAGRGWRVIAIGHRESGRDQLRQAFQQNGGLAAVDASARERPKHAARFADLDAAYAEAKRPCRLPFLVLAGHSMGSQTTMMEAGARALIGSMGRNRFNAYVALSPQGIGTTYAAGAWSGVSKPVLVVTGTNDRVADGDYTVRLTAFEGLPGGNKRLAVIPGAGHLQIGGIGSASVSTTVNALVIEFLEQQASGRLAPSRVSGAKVTEK
jgi:pimeloyl-ACP methyl ester carboxylesterase